MRLRACIALLLFVSACATSAPSPEAPVNRDPRLANLQRAAALPWTDRGRCVVQEASQPWPVLAERCYHALDHDRVEFHDAVARCSVASAEAAAMGLGVCVLAAPELVAGAVVVTGVVVVGFAIKEALDVYEARSHSRSKPVAETRAVTETESGASERDRRRCEPLPALRHLGGNALHNKCADGIPNNSFPGRDVLVNGKNFDALQLATRTLWEVKTDDFDIHSPRSQEFFARVKLSEMQREAELAKECGYNFVVGVKSAAHKEALGRLDETLTIIVMGWC